MTKTLTYSGLVIAILVVILTFVTAKTYSQLAVAVILYPILVLIAFMIFPRRRKLASSTVELTQKSNTVKQEVAKVKNEFGYVADIDRRAFIKLIGATGISFFLFSLFGRRVETLLFGRAAGPGITPPTSGSDQFGLSGPAVSEGYKISQIDEGDVTYYGFTNREGAWVIMKQDTNENSFRYAKGSSDFPASWANRENLKYDYFYNLN